MKASKVLKRNPARNRKGLEGGTAGVLSPEDRVSLRMVIRYLIVGAKRFGLGWWKTK